MFRRVVFEAWSSWAAIVGFVFTATVFFGAMWRCCRLGRTQAEALARLPFEGESKGGPQS